MSSIDTMSSIDAMPETSLIAGKIRQIRRRQFCARLLGSICVALCIFGIAVVLCSFRSIKIPLHPGWVSLFGAILAAGAFVYSIFSMPARKETVKLTDRKLNLQQRLETAWECLAPREDIDRLLLADTGRRLSGIRPKSVVPIRIGRVYGALLTAGLVMLASLGIIRILEGTGHSSLPAILKALKIEHIEGETPQRPDTTSAAISRKEQGNGPVPGSADSAPGNIERTPIDSNAVMTGTPDSMVYQSAPPSSSAADPDAGIAAAGSQPASGSPPSGGAPPTAEAERPGNLRSEAAGARNSQEETPVSASENDPGDTSFLMGSTADSPGRSKTGNEQGASTEARNSQPADGNMGNIPAAGKASEKPGLNAPSQNSASLRGEPPIDYDTLPMGTEQALSRENIPPGLKKYVMDYFRTIHP